MSALIKNRSKSALFIFVILAMVTVLATGCGEKIAGLPEGTRTLRGKAFAKIGLGALAIAPSKTSTLYAGTLGKGIFYSTNNGATWVAAKTGLPDAVVISIAVDPKVSAIIYAGWEWMGLFNSMNSGETWLALNIGLDQAKIYSIAIDPKTTTTLYLAANDGRIYK